MKYFAIFLFLVFQVQLNAQVNGNGKITTKTFSIENLIKLEINFTGDIIIDTQTETGITITTDENVIEYINVNMKKGYLDLTQLKWIEPTKRPVVIIGAPNLESLICDAHSKVEINNINRGRFKVKANVGTISMNGKVDYLDLKVKLAKVNTEQLIVKKADVNIKSWGEVKLGMVEDLRSSVHESGRLTSLNKPKKMSGDAKEAIAKNDRPLDKNVKYIDFKIKNNSLKRNHFYVVGPKPDGSRFSYGFPMNPGQVKEKHWTTGSEVYKVNKLGIRKLVKTIKAEDESETVDIFVK